PRLCSASFRPHLAMTPLRFANPSPPSGWIEDSHLQAVDHARHTTTKPRTSARGFADSAVYRLRSEDAEKPVRQFVIQTDTDLVHGLERDVVPGSWANTCVRNTDCFKGVQWTVW